MTIRARLKRLEGRARQAASADPPDWLSEGDWLAQFEALGREGYFDGEPDFPTALAEYRAAVEQAWARPDPPFDPPAHFMADRTYAPQLRVLNWRDASRFPDLHATWCWLGEMFDRVSSGTPPVTEAEFAELARWFEAHEPQVSRLPRSPSVLELGEGRWTSLANLRYGLGKGPRALGAGRLAEDLRLLRTRCGEEGP